MKIGVVLLVVLLVFVGCGRPPRKSQAEYAQEYVEGRSDLSPELKSAIMAGKVIQGMDPDEAYAAAGQFIYNLKPDPRWGDNHLPPQVIFSQRRQPDNSEIEMTFRNKSQFSTEEPVSFTARFTMG